MGVALNRQPSRSFHWSFHGNDRITPFSILAVSYLHQRPFHLVIKPDDTHIHSCFNSKFDKVKLVADLKKTNPQSVVNREKYWLVNFYLSKTKILTFSHYQVLLLLSSWWLMQTSRREFNCASLVARFLLAWSGMIADWINCTICG